MISMEGKIAFKKIANAAGWCENGSNN